MPTDFLEIRNFNFDCKKLQSQSQKHSTVTSQTQISVIQSQNQQQPIVPIQQCFNIVHNLNVLQFNHKKISTIAEKLSSRNVTGLHDVTACG